MMTEPTSPFAEFAEPHHSAVEHFHEVLETERDQRRTRRYLLGMLLVGGALGASVGQAIAAGPQAQFAAFVLALVGGAAGLLAGWGVAAASWGFLAFQTQTYLPDMKPLGAELVGGNRWDRLTTWLAVWGALGIAIGAAVGAGAAIEQFSQFAVADAVGLPWQWFGALGGLLLVAALWAAIHSRRLAALVLAKIVVITLVVFLLLVGS